MIWPDSQEMIQARMRCYIRLLSDNDCNRKVNPAHFFGVRQVNYLAHAGYLC